VTRDHDLLALQQSQDIMMITPEGLHRAIKRRAVEEVVTMAEMLRKVLEERYG